MNGTVTIAQAGAYPYTSAMIATPMTPTLIGYARCSTDRQDLDVQRRPSWSWASPRTASTPITASPAPPAPDPVSIRPSPPCARATP